MTTAEFSLIVGSAGFALGLINSAAGVWRFRHAVRVSVDWDYAKNADGTRRAVDYWKVRVINIRQRPVSIDEIWFQAEAGGGNMAARVVDGAPFPIRLDDHASETVTFDLWSLFEQGKPQPRCAVAIEAGGRSHVGWVSPRPRAWRLRRAPRKPATYKVAEFKTSPSDEG